MTATCSPALVTVPLTPAECNIFHPPLQTREKCYTRAKRTRLPNDKRQRRGRGIAPTNGTNDSDNSERQAANSV